MTSFLRRLFRWKTLLILLSSLALLCVLVFAALHLPPVRAFVLGKAEAYLRASFGVELAAKSLRYNLLTLSVSLRDVSLSSVGPGHPPFLTAARIRVRIPLALVLGREVRIKDLEIDGPRVEIVFAEDGASNLPVFPQSASSTSPNRLPAFILERCLLNGGTFLLSDPSREIRIETAGIGLEIRRIKGWRHSLRLVLDAPGAVTAGRIRVPVRDIRLQGTFDRDGASIEKLSVDSGNSHLSLSGNVPGFFPFSIAAGLEAELSGPDIQNILSVKRSLEGRFTLSADFRGSLQDLAAAGKISARKAGIGTLRGAELSSDFRWQGGTLQDFSFKTVAPWGNLSGRFSHTDNAGGGQNAADIAWTSLDLGLVASFFESPMRVETLSSGSAAARWRKTLLASLEGKIDMTFAPAAGVTPSLRSFAVAGRLNGEIRPPSSSPAASSLVRIEGRVSGAGGSELTLAAKAVFDSAHVSVESLRVSIAGGTLDLSGDIPFEGANAPIAFTAGAAKIDLEKTAAFFGLALPVRGLLAFEGKGSGTLRRPEIGFDVSAEKLSFAEIPVGGVNLNGKAVGGRLDVQLSLASFPVSAAGGIVLRAPYELGGTVSINGLTLASLAAAFPKVAPTGAEGNLTGTVTIGASLADLNRTLRLDALLEKVDFGMEGHRLANRGPIKLAFGRDGLAIGEMSLTGPGTDIAVRGTLPVRPSPEAGLSIEAGLDLDLLNIAAKDLRLTGRMQVSSTIKGTLSSPQVGLNARVEGAAVQWKPLGLPIENLALTLTVKENEARLEKAAFGWGRARAEISGRFPLALILPSAGSLPAYEFRGEIRNLDPADFGKAFLTRPAGSLGGAIGLDFEGRGSSLDLKALSGKVRFTTLALTAEGIPLAQTKPTEIVIENGKVSIRSLDLSGGGTALGFGGGIDLAGAKFENLAVRGRLDLALLRPLLGGGSISGALDLEAGLSGDLNAPRFDGNVVFRDAAMRWPEYGLTLSGFAGRIGIADRRLLTLNLKGNCNQGRLEIDGSVDLSGSAPAGTRVQITGRDILTNYPQGLRADWTLALSITSAGRIHRLSGKATLVQGEYTEAFDIRSKLFGLLKGGPARIYVERNSLLDNVSFDVDIATSKPFLIRNNLADARVRAGLKLMGTPYTPGLGGGIQLLDGGKITFSGNTYEIETGRIDFVNPNRIVPNLNLKAATSIGGYEIQLTVTGAPDNLQVGLSSDPPLSQTDIISLLSAGVLLQNVSSTSAGGVKNQALSYLEQALMGQVGKTVATGLGLETLTLDTSLAAPEVSPEARITAGQHLTPQLQFIISQDLRNANVRTIILNYAPFRRINLQALNQDGSEYRFSLQGTGRFGPAPTPSPSLNPLGARVKLVIGSIAFNGTLVVPEKTLQKRLSLKTGRKFDLFGYEKALQGLRDFYHRSGYLDLDLESERVTMDGRVNVAIRIEAGPKVEFAAEGIPLTRSLRKTLENAWMEESFKSVKPVVVEEKVRGRLYAERYFLAKVEARVEDANPSLRRVIIRIDRGRRFLRPEVIFSGNGGFKASQLRGLLGSSADMSNSVFMNPGESSRVLQNFYRANGYLQARVERPRIDYDEDNGSVRVTFGIDEGRRFIVRGIAFAGNRFFDTARLIKTAGLHEKAVVRFEEFDQSRSNLQAAYEDQGFIDAAIDARMRLDSAAGAVDIDYAINEGRQAFIRDVRIEGNRLTRAPFLRRILTFRAGDLVSYRKINESRKNLYDLGVFSMLNIDLVPEDSAGEKEPPAATAAVTDQRRPYQARIELAEARPYQIVGGFQYDTETAFGGNVSLVYDNLFGRGIALGGSTLLNRREQVGRVFVRSQYFFGRRIDSNLSFFYDNRIEPEFTVERNGAAFLQQIRFWEKFVISYNYTFERDKVASPVPTLTRTNNIGRIGLSLAYDGRDNFLNPAEGQFISQALEYGARALGSDVRYWRYFGQTFLYFRMTPGLLFAAGARLGLAGGFGTALPPELRFFAGGSTTVRGFAFHGLEPISPATGQAEGGEAMLVLNAELRFPITSPFGGALFLDMGNVYPRVSDFRPFNLRTGAGAGLRLILGSLVGRFDVGFNLAPRAGEKPYRIYFSIGQSF
jgi:outer membrane protein insertion porin family